MLWLESELNILFELQTINRKVQGVPQSQIAANPRHQEEDKKDKTKNNNNNNKAQKRKKKKKKKHTRSN